MGTQIKDVVIKPDAPNSLLLDKHADYIAAYGSKKDDYEYTLSEYLRMSGIYWGLTVMDLMSQLHRMSRDEIIDFIKASQHECGGISASVGHDPHLLYTLSAVQVLCNQYWPPERGTGCYGALQVTTVSRHRGPDCYITTIHLRQHDSPTDRRITHYYYPGWLDQGVPKHHTSLVKFTEHVRKQLDDTPNLGPTVVHCSAGIGRSGTFVAILWLIQLCARGILPDVRLAVRDLRRHRVLMVQNVEQYILVHQCILHWLGGNMERPRTQNVVSFKIEKPQTHRRSKRDPKNRRRNSDYTIQPKVSPSSIQASHTPQPQHTAWQSLRDSLHALNPGKLLQRLRPPSAQNNSQNKTQL